MVGLEYLVYEILVLFAGLIGVEELSATTLLMNFGSFILMIPYGLMLTMAVFIGNSFGEGSAEKARKYTRMGIVAALLVIPPLSLSLFLLRDYMPLIFTTEPTVIRLFSSYLYCYCLNLFPDVSQVFLTGVIKGIGKQETAGVAAVIANLFVAIPSSYLLGIYFEFGVPGLFFGLMCGNTVLATLYTRVCISEPWDNIAERISKE